MAGIEKISIVLPVELATLVRRAVEQGEYASSSEVVRDALSDWNLKRSLQQKATDHLREGWQEAVGDPSPGTPMDDVLDRLESKYQALADRAEQ